MKVYSDLFFIEVTRQIKLCDTQFLLNRRTAVKLQRLNLTFLKGKIAPKIAKGENVWFFISGYKDQKCCKRKATAICLSVLFTMNKTDKGTGINV